MSGERLNRYLNRFPLCHKSTNTPIKLVKTKETTQLREELQKGKSTI